MRRFFFNPADISTDSAFISGDEYKHIVQVLRCQTGESCLLLDGEGHEYPAVINAIEKDRVTFDVSDKIRNTSEPATRVTLYQGMPKSSKLDVIVQKCTELGVSAVVPFISERCIKLPDKGTDKKTDRLIRIAKEAVKQSRRALVPIVSTPINFDELLRRTAEHKLVILCYEEEAALSLKTVLTQNDAADIALVIGPEGGFSPEEAKALIKNGASAVTLGKRILRTETAGAAALAMIMYEKDECG